MKFLIAILLICAIAKPVFSKKVDFRKQKFEAYRPINDLAREQKTSTYSSFENPTGIYYSAGNVAELTVGPLKGETISLRIHDFGPSGEDARYSLKEGKNRLPITVSGLGYIEYFTPNWKTAQPVEIKFTNGKINGVFDSRNDNNKTWQSLLSNSVSDILDIKGKYVQLAFDKESLRKYCPTDGLGLIQVYDSLIHIQYYMMGYVKYHHIPKNHLFGRVIWKGFMHADGIGAAFNKSTMKNLADPEKLKKDVWGVSHEFGHVNQVRPGMRWVSTTEVTNNIYSAYAQYLFNPKSLRLEHESCKTDNGRFIGGRFDSYLNSAIVHGEQWLCQKGPDKMTGYEQGGDHFVKLCPLWQLQLYYGIAGLGNKDLYPDVFEIVRNTSDDNKSDGELQIGFMKNVCDVQKEDLTDFFQKCGMLKPIDKDMDDYKRARLTITQKMCDDLIAYARRYPKPQSPVIYYISGNSAEAFARKLPVSGVYNKGITMLEGKRTISHSVWKNVTVFETYKNDELIQISMVGTGSSDNSSTLVFYPEGATRIEAVAWDGTRTLVYGKR